MNRKALFLLVIVLLALLPMAGTALGQDEPLPGWGDLEPGAWTMISPGGDTICSNGTPYAFFARPADVESDRLLIHFQGGGACWFGEICDLMSSPTYDPFVTEDDDPTNWGGFFNFAHEENPFTDYNMVMVPYCTADVHIGNSVTSYTVAATDESEEREVTIYHNGYVNAMTVLEWTFENYTDPAEVFVTGCSAGSIPSPFYTQHVAEAYPDAFIAQLGDAAGGYRNPDLSSLVFGPWGTMDILTDAYSHLTIDDLTFEQFYIVAGSLYPEITFTQYNTYGDAVQRSFLALTGIFSPLHELLMANFDDINAEVGNFRNYLDAGDTHCITLSDTFYDVESGGVRLVDWVAALAAGEEIDDVMCTECEAAP